MTSPPLSPLVTRFLAEEVHSVEQLEILLLLWRERDRTWSPAEVSQVLRIDPGSAQERLEGWMARQLLRSAAGGTFRYGPASAEADATLTAVADAYAQRRVTLIELIFSKPSPKLRSFADAFRFKKRDD